MTVSTNYAPLSYAWTTSGQALPVTWPFLTGSLVVYGVTSAGTRTQLSLGTHYSVSGGTGATGLPGTGQVTMIVAPGSYTSARIERSTPRAQAIVFPETGPFPAKTVEGALDRLSIVDQELTSKVGSIESIVPLPAASKFVAWNSSGSALINVDLGIAIGTVTTGAPGTQAAASIGGTAPNYTLNLTIPQGASGASGNGSGNVTGPASATADAIALFNGTTGALIKDSGMTINDVRISFSTRSSAAAATIPAGVTTVQTLAYATMGDGGGARYIVTASTTFYQFQSADGRRWDLDKYQPINVAMFGAKGDAAYNQTTMAVTGTDDTTAIQNAIDWCLRSGVAELSLTGKHKTSNTLHLGWGDAFYTIRLNGAASAGSYAGTTAGSAIFPTATDRPAINIQGGRGSGVVGVTIYGQNYRHFWDNVYVSATANNFSSIPSDWLAAGLRVSGTTPGGIQRYSPYAAITIDAYADVQPSGGYPAVVYPAWTGLSTQYGKLLSSETTIQGCRIHGFGAAVVQSPNGPLQGDFLRVRECEIGECVYGMSVGNHQSRNVEFRNITYVGLHTVLSNAVFGSQVGVFGGPIENISGGQSYQFCDFQSASYTQPITIKDLYFESQVRVGNVGPNGTTYPYPIEFVGGLWGFSDQHGIIPASYIFGSYNQAVTLRHVGIANQRRIGCLVAGQCHVTVDNCYWISGLTDISGANGSTAYRRAMNFTGGQFLPMSAQGTNASSKGLATWIGTTFGAYAPSDYAALSHQTQSVDVIWQNGAGSVLRGNLTQANTGFVDNNNRRWRFDVPIAFFTTGYLSVAPSLSAVGDTLTFTALSWMQPRYDLRFEVGKIIYHVNTSTVFVVTAVGAADGSGNFPITAKQMNNLKLNPTTGAVVANLCSDLTLAGTLCLYNTAIDLPQQVHFGTFTSGSKTVSSVSRGDGYGGNISSYLSNGDKLCGYQYPIGGTQAVPITGTGYPSAPTIATVTNGSPGSIAMSDDAIASGVFPIYPLPIR